jgi:hypothetical protein
MGLSVSKSASERQSKLYLPKNQTKNKIDLIFLFYRLCYYFLHTLRQLLKYAGPLLFDTKKHVIWQDAKFFRRTWGWMRPTNYLPLLQNDACVTTFGLPIHPDTVGKPNRVAYNESQQKTYYTKLKDHCDHVVGAIKTRPDVTDSTDAVSEQCLGYIDAVEKAQTGNKNILNEGLIDSAIILWNQRSEECRSFNDRLRFYTK